MDNNQLTGQLAKLPDGQDVRIEIIYSDGYASVRRINGPQAGSLAICLVSKLESPDTLLSVTEDKCN